MPRPLSYGERLIRMEGVITEVHDGSAVIDLKGRLGRLTIPLRMLIADAPLAAGQEVGWNMSFPEQLSTDKTTLHPQEKEKEEP